jgi:hypothetical protein
MSATATAPQISCDEALRTAQADAEKAYRDLTRFRIEIMLHDDGWHVDYELPLTGIQGGGPHYVIDANSGAVVRKRYDQ